jgi:hypothetical protein
MPIVFGLSSLSGTINIAQRQAQSKVLHLPDSGDVRMASPNRRYVLYGVPFKEGFTENPQFWIQDNLSGKKTLLFGLSRTLTARWAPDSSAFAVNDEFSSDTTAAYIYAVPTLTRLNLGEKIIAAYPKDERFTNGHAYFEIEGWKDPKHVTVVFHGHADGESPMVCFELRYLVARDGSATKLSEVSGLPPKAPCS